MPSYQELLAGKERKIIESGFDCNNTWPWLYPFQSFLTRISLKYGRYAIFADCGLGKTRMQLTWADEVSKYTNAPVLIFAPLAVVSQTIDEAIKIGITCYELYDEMQQMHELPPGLYITNYEQIENIIPEQFSGIVLDESSILKNEEGTYRNLIINLFKSTQYKLACTATPSPNDPMELGNHAEFLGVMNYNELLAMYFVHDGGETAKWRLKGHSTKLFWKFVGSWSKMLSKPSDIGFEDTGYDLPALNIVNVQIETPKRDNNKLFNDIAISATNFNSELRITKVQRIEQVIKIVKHSTESFIIWVKHNEEANEITKLIPGSVNVQGSDSPEYKKNKLLGFAKNEYRVLISKVKIAGFGMNFQNCHNMVFASPDFSFEGIYQALRRSLRFGQKFEVNAWLITTDTMVNVVEAFKRKKLLFEEMQENMRQNTIDESQNKKTVYMRSEKIYKSNYADIRLGDSIQLIDTLPDESIGFSIWSPPFPELYVYSDQVEDLGNCKDYDQFMQFFNLIPPKIFSKMWSGRNVAIHCMDTPIQKGKEGYIGLRDFSSGIINAMIAAGFIYHSRVTIWKNPVTEMQRTKALGLLHKQVKKDAAMSRVGIPDYLLVFRKPGEHKHPVKCNISVDTWQQYASPVWMDIDYGDTLNARAGRDEKDEKHICPLQLPTIRRATTLWSNEGDNCLSIFGGVGSEPTTFIEMGRNAIAFELKESYYDEMVRNVKAAESLKSQNDLFAA